MQAPIGSSPRPTLLRSESKGSFTKERFVQDMIKAEEKKATDKKTFSVERVSLPKHLPLQAWEESKQKMKTSLKADESYWADQRKEEGREGIVASDTPQPPAVISAHLPNVPHPPSCSDQYVDLPPKILHNLRVAARTRENGGLPPLPTVPAVPPVPSRKVRAQPGKLPPVRLPPGLPCALPPY
jgi:hypothetical protein